MLKNSVKLNRLGKEKKNTFYFLILVIKGLTDMLRNWHTMTDRQTDRQTGKVNSALFCVQSYKVKLSIGTILSKCRWDSVFFCFYPTVMSEIGRDDSG